MIGMYQQPQVVYNATVEPSDMGTVYIPLRKLHVWHVKPIGSTAVSTAAARSSHTANDAALAI